MDNPIDNIEFLQGQKDLAVATGAFYKELIEQGLNYDQATVLTQTWLEGLLRMGGSSRGNDK